MIIHNHSRSPDLGILVIVLGLRYVWLHNNVRYYFTICFCDQDLHFFSSCPIFFCKFEEIIFYYNMLVKTEFIIFLVYNVFMFMGIYNNYVFHNTMFISAKNSSL